MEKKEKNSKRSAKLIVVLIALLLIACSLLGFTLARYITEERDGQGGVNIAQWDIDWTDTLTTAEGTGAALAMISPAMEEYDSTNRTHAITDGDSKALIITNKSDVKAIVTLKITNKLNFYSNSEKDEETGLPETVTKPTSAEWTNVELSQIITAAKPTGAEDGELALVKVYTKDGTEKKDSGLTKDTQGNVTTYKITLDVGEKLEVTIGVITWTTDLDSDDSSGSGGDDNRGTYGDARDTWIGENVGSVGFAYSWSAVQGSQVPTP